MNELNEFLDLNNIKEDDLFDALHLDIREIVLRITCEKLKKDELFFNWAKRVFFLTSNDMEATRKVVDRACKCKLSNSDMIWMKDSRLFFLSCHSFGIFRIVFYFATLTKRLGFSSNISSNSHRFPSIPLDSSALRMEGLFFTS